MAQFGNSKQRTEPNPLLTSKDYALRKTSSMKKSSVISYGRKRKEEWKLLEAQLKSDTHTMEGRQNVLPTGGGQNRYQDELLESLQPGNVQRLVEKFRRLGEQMPNNKPFGHTSPFWTKSFSTITMENSVPQAKIGILPVRRKPGWLRQNRTKNEKRILSVSSKFSSDQPVSKSVNLSQELHPPAELFKTSNFDHKISENFIPKEGLLHVSDCWKDLPKIVFPANSISGDPGNCINKVINSEPAKEKPLEEIKTETTPGPSGIQNLKKCSFPNDMLYEEIDEHCYISKPSSLPPFTVKKKVDKDILLSHSNVDAGAVPNNSSELSISDVASTGHDVRTNQNKEDEPTYDAIYEEIDITPPLKVLPSPMHHFCSSGRCAFLCHRDENKSRRLNSTRCDSQTEDSESSFYDSFTDYSNLDEYDVIDESEFMSTLCSYMNSGEYTCNKNTVISKTVHDMPLEGVIKSQVSCSKCGNNSDLDISVDNSKLNSIRRTKKHEHMSNCDENVYEEYDFSPASNGFITDSEEHGSGCCINSDNSSLYDSFSSDDEMNETSASITGIHDLESLEPVNKLKMVILEIIDTEKKYIERLKLINEDFHKALIAWNAERNLLPAEVFQQIFRNIDVIYKLHSSFFLPELESCIQSEIGKQIEDVFLKGADFLKLYSDYSCNFSSAMRLIELWKNKVPEFNKFIQEIQRKPICRSLTLEHHMLEPILRIPRYELLLNKYLEQLPSGSVESERTAKALKKIVAAASHCNDFINSMEKYKKVLDVQQSLWGKVNLLIPTRELVLDGRMKVTQQMEKEEEKHLFLFNDTLLVCKIFPRGISPPYKVTLRLDISEMKVVDRNKEETVETFFVFSKEGYVEMHPSTKEDKEKWISAIQTVIMTYNALEESRKALMGSKTPVSSNYMKNVSRQKSIPGMQAPIWIKDPLASHCMQCGDKFNAIKRRHHCRACGILVCNRCSSHQSTLAFDSYSQEHRVCDKCFSEILKSKENELSSKSNSLVLNEAQLSSTIVPKSEGLESEEATAYIIPSEEKSSLYQQPEDATITKLTSNLEAVIT